MPLTCNIDARGKSARLIYGILMIAVGVALMILWSAGSGSIARWAVAGGCVAAGLFGLFEARAGWCVMRAMGVRTPM